MKDFEKLGVFYLGRLAGPEAPNDPEPVLYDARDLTTHGVIVGMTGSGKTGLGIGLIEEAALDATSVKPRKSDITVESVSLVWIPRWMGEGGSAHPAR